MRKISSVGKAKKTNKALTNNMFLNIAQQPSTLPHPLLPCLRPWLSIAQLSHGVHTSMPINGV
jgi:hypothetical protein